MSEGAGKPPVVIVNPETTVTSGTEVQEKLIAAARVFSDLLKPTLGPRGLDKMLYKTDGNTAITNDGAKIVAELMVKHPAAKMMVSMGNSQEETCGDGVTTTMLLCGALLEEANNLLRKGLHPLTLVEGYRLSLAACIGQMDTDTRGASEERLTAVAETALRGKGAEAALGHFSSIISQALSLLAENRDDAGAEHIAMFKTGIGGLRDSRLIRGVVINRRVLMDNLPNHLEDANVAALGGDLKIRSMTRDAEIKITSADQLDSFVDAERSRKNAIAEAIIFSGAGVVLCSGEVDRDILHRLSDSEIIAVGELDESELRNAAEATGANIVDSVLDIEADDLGVCGSLDWERREASDQVEDIIRIDGCPNPKAVTIEVGGSGDTATEEIIRGLHDSLRATSIALADDELLPGAGSIHARMAAAVRHASEAEPGRARLAMDAYARALETIPATLVENSGGDSLDRILELRAASNDDDFVGITPEGDVGPASGVWHPRAVIEEGIESATETAMSMLRIDQVISARGD
ncbi:MAG: TCP-1/cpn60 chaperonin family protein [Candidatus Thermoplasmatota archaeon]|nr:TCP-1/cpn60 chaperonin family protein [Candidatus Thermoplasmatota archaeon]